MNVKNVSIPNPAVVFFLAVLAWKTDMELPLQVPHPLHAGLLHLLTKPLPCAVGAEHWPPVQSADDEESKEEEVACLPEPAWNEPARKKVIVEL